MIDAFEESRWTRGVAKHHIIVEDVASRKTGTIDETAADTSRQEAIVGTIQGHTDQSTYQDSRYEVHRREKNRRGENGYDLRKREELRRQESEHRRNDCRSDCRELFDKRSQKSEQDRVSARDRLARKIIPERRQAEWITYKTLSWVYRAYETLTR